MLSDAGKELKAAKRAAAGKTVSVSVEPATPATDATNSDSVAGVATVARSTETNTDGAKLLDDIEAHLLRFMAYQIDHAHAHTLWIAHCWFMNCWESTPRIAFLSPEPSSGKTRALEVTGPLVPRPIHSVNATGPYLFRKVSDQTGRPTILYDECDTIFGPEARSHEDVRGLINAGHRKNATAGRCVVKGKLIETEELPAYCAVALAGLDDLPDTIMTRSVIIRMKRRKPDQTVEPWRDRINGPEADLLVQRLLDWSNTATPLENGWPEMPEPIQDRDADVWEALLAVADLAGGHWPQTARASAVKLVNEAKDRTPSLGVQLLRDIRTVFVNTPEPVLPTAEILSALNSMEEAPWSKISRKGEPLNAMGLASRLKRYGIRSHNERVGGEVLKCYRRVEFEDAWDRYVSISVEGATPATGATDEATVAGVATASETNTTREELF